MGKAFLNAETGTECQLHKTLKLNYAILIYIGIKAGVDIKACPHARGM